MSTRVAHLGLGRMGSGIAANLRQAGFPLVVWNRTPGRSADLEAQGARAAATAAEAVQGAEVVVSNLFDDASALAVLDGDDGMLAGLSPGAVHVSTTTISPSAARRLAERHAEHGSALVLSPVLGRPDAAAAGELIGLVAGPPEHVATAKPVIEAFSSTILEVGEDHGQAAALKLLFNGTLAVVIELVGEMLAFADTHGIDRDLAMLGITRVLTGAGPGYAERILDRDFTPGFSMDGGRKDVELVLQAAQESGASLPLMAATRDRYLTALAMGWADKDWGAVSDVSRALAGLAVPDDA